MAMYLNVDSYGMDNRYPSTGDHQSVLLECDYPDMEGRPS